MKIDLETYLKNPMGKPFEDNAKLGAAIYSALSTPLPNDNADPVEKQMLRYRLIQRMAIGGETDVTAEEIAQIKERCSKLFPIVVTGAVVDALESLSQPVSISGERAA